MCEYCKLLSPYDSILKVVGEDLFYIGDTSKVIGNIFCESYVKFCPVCGKKLLEKEDESKL